MSRISPQHGRGRGRGDARDPDAGRRLRRRSSLLPTTLLGLLLTACAPAPLARVADDPPGPRFDVGRDTFAFPNLVRAERPGWNDAFANYCIIMARAAGQFFRAARFDPEAPPVSSAEYTRLTREVLATPPWAPPRPAAARIVIPGHPDLRALSRAEEGAVKAAFGSNVLSMAHWRNWRVAVPLSPEHQARVASGLREEVDAGRPAPLMITNFPHADLLNHAVLVYDYRTSAGVVEFLAYDPNDPGSPLSLHFDAATRGFWVEPLPYSPPGRVRAFRLYTSPWL